MVLNQELDFKDAPNDVRAAFSGPVEKRLLITGHRLYKFTQHPLVNQDRVSPWWSSVDSLNPSDTGLDGLMQRSERLGVDPNVFARARNAVTRQWNSMSELLVIELLQPAYGFLGRVSHQMIDTNSSFKNVVFIGGAIQLWIPNINSQFVIKI